VPRGMTRRNAAGHPARASGLTALGGVRIGTEGVSPPVHIKYRELVWQNMVLQEEKW